MASLTCAGEGLVTGVAPVGPLHARARRRVLDVKAVLAHHVTLAVRLGGEGDGAVRTLERLLA